MTILRIKKMHCKHGHEIDVVGRYKRGDCCECVRLKNSLRAKKRKNPFCKRGHEIALVGRKKSNGVCRECHRVASRLYTQTNSKKIAAYRCKRRIANPEKISASHLKWHLANLDYNLKWQRANPEKVSGQGHRRRARKLNSTIDFFNEKTWFENTFEAQQGLCYYCKKILSKYHIDHKTPLSLGGSHSPDNLCIACPNCNCRKGKKTAEQFIVLC